jgi:hypothetical protein
MKPFSRAAASAPVIGDPSRPANGGAGSIKALTRHRDEADGNSAPTVRNLPNLVTADVYFGLQDPELAGLAVVRKRGDGMGDTLRCGDCALVDTKQTEIAEGGIFALLVKEQSSASIYQVEKVYEDGRSTGRIRCTPRNPAYTPFELTLGEDARIIGRVVQKVTRFL